jgi:hypothetical protein
MSHSQVVTNEEPRADRTPLPAPHDQPGPAGPVTRETTAQGESSAMLNELLTLAQAAQDVVLAAPDPSTAPTDPAGAPKITVDTSGVIKFFATVIAPIIIAGLGVIFLTRAKSGQVSQTVTSSGIALVGVAFIVGAGVLMGLGGTIVDLLFS